MIAALCRLDRGGRGGDPESVTAAQASVVASFEHGLATNR